jgi:hypothetical protein
MQPPFAAAHQNGESVTDIHVFADEAGTLAFSAKDRSRYWILTTVTVSDCSIGDALLSLRRKLAWEGVATHPEFRASEERQPVRDQVFASLQGLDFRVDATIYEKRKVQPHIAGHSVYFYQLAWYYHLRHLIPAIAPPGSRLLLVAATIGERRRTQEAFAEAVRKVIQQVAPGRDARSAFWLARTDPCLWLADYCSWAIQRKWEHQWQGAPDDRSRRLISGHIRSEFDIFHRSTELYY